MPQTATRMLGIYLWPACIRADGTRVAGVVGWMARIRALGIYTCLLGSSQAPQGSLPQTLYTAGIDDLPWDRVLCPASLPWTADAATLTRCARAWGIAQAAWLVLAVGASPEAQAARTATMAVWEMVAESPERSLHEVFCYLGSRLGPKSVQ